MILLIKNLRFYKLLINNYIISFINLLKYLIIIIFKIIKFYLLKLIYKYLNNLKKL